MLYWQAALVTLNEVNFKAHQRMRVHAHGQVGAAVLRGHTYGTRR